MIVNRSAGVGISSVRVLAWCTVQGDRDILVALRGAFANALGVLENALAATVYASLDDDA
jgi:hypothetical protein